MIWRGFAVLAVVLTLGLTPASADQQAPAGSDPALDGTEGLPLPIALGGAFNLVDQQGNPRTQVDPGGQMQLLFFGYASCREICSSVLPQMDDVANILAARGIGLTPVLITVDPVRDTVETLGPSLQGYGENFVGLTGTDAALAVAYKAFGIETELVFDDPFRGPVYAHGSFLYLMNAKGGFLTLIPPILATDRVADLIAGYADKG